MSQSKERRLELIRLSEEVAHFVENGQHDRINEALIAKIYCKGEHRIFKKLSQWNREGKQVIKGSKAFAVWGKPIGEQRKEKEPDAEISEEEMKYYPLCYLFSNAQVKEVEE